MNQDQALGTLRNVIAAAGGYALARGWVSTDALVAFTGVVVAVFPMVWSWWAHTADQQMKAVERNLEVKAIVVEKDANGTAAKAAADPDRNKVILEGQKTAAESGTAKK